MAREDLNRLHSALERQRLEFNKAGIDATLKCETSMLASGNPKGSRFNKYDTDQSQIEIVESLLDRFDLVFTLKDIPDKTKDRKIAQSKIAQRSESGLIAKNELEPDNRSAAKAELSPEKVRSWVAMARQNVRPVIRDDDVAEKLEDYYVSIRQQNADNTDDDESPVPATARNLDGVLRLSEACARMRLSDEVEMVDAEMAIALVKVSLEDVGYDPETGKMDADWANGRGSFSQQERMDKMKGLIGELEGEEPAEEDNLVQTAVDAGIEQEKVIDAIEKLARKGEIYEPQTGYYRTS